MVASGLDRTRPFGGSARPLEIGIWYPTRVDSGPALTVGAYSRALDTETAGKPTIDAGRVGDSMQARLDARPALEPNALVVYLPGFGANATVHAWSCERLAGHGFTVVALASTGSTPRGMTSDFEGVEAQYRDAEWAVAQAELTLHRHFRQIAVVGVSFGSLAGWRMLVGGDERVQALVSLDGSLGFIDGAELMVAHPSDRPARGAVLHLNTRTDLYNDLSFLEAQPYALVQVVTFDGYEHDEFYPGALMGSVRGTSAAVSATQHLETVLSLAERFIDRALAADRGCVSAAVGTTTCLRPALEAPSEYEASRMVATASGRAALRALHQRAVAMGLVAPLVREGLLEAVGDTTTGADHRDVVRLRAQLFPTSFRARFALGEELEERGETAAALCEFEAVERISPRVRDASVEIAKLRAAPARGPSATPCAEPR